ncbi:MAG: hypothetical protein NVS3B20_01090 [Polyangiales bacterium]
MRAIPPNTNAAPPTTAVTLPATMSVTPSDRARLPSADSAATGALEAGRASFPNFTEDAGALSFA